MIIGIIGLSVAFLVTACYATYLRAVVTVVMNNNEEILTKLSAQPKVVIQSKKPTVH